MTTLVKTVAKNMFPRSVLRWRAHKIVSGGMDPDLCLLANFARYLSEVQGGEKFVEHFSKSRGAVDVGACGGEYSMVMAAVFGKVLSVEPTADMAMVLRKSLPRNCEVIECALGETIGEVSIRVPKIGGARMNALATIADHGFDFSNVGPVDIAVVKQFTVDQLARERSLRPSFIKIDVEGYEGSVLLGALEVIRTCKPVLMIEIERRHNKQFAEIFSLLGSQGYATYHFGGGRLCLSSPDVVDKAFHDLKNSDVSGMKEVIAAKESGRYINNFVFLPMHGS